MFLERFAVKIKFLRQTTIINPYTFEKQIVELFEVDGFLTSEKSLRNVQLSFDFS
jgi:hypothetical protein